MTFSWKTVFRLLFSYGKQISDPETKKSVENKHNYFE